MSPKNYLKYLDEGKQTTKKSLRQPSMKLLSYYHQVSNPNYRKLIV